MVPNKYPDMSIELASLPSLAYSPIGFEGPPCSILVARDIPLVTLHGPATFWLRASLSNLMVSVRAHTVNVSHKELQSYGPNKPF